MRHGRAENTYCTTLQPLLAALRRLLQQQHLSFQGTQKSI